MINPFGLILTVSLYKFAQWGIKRNLFGKLSSLPPIFIAGCVLLIIMEVFQINIDTYNESASILTLLLIPATISLGYPIYKYKNLLLRNKHIIYSAFVFSSFVAVVTTYIIAKLCNTDLKVILSMLPKSVTAPMAVEISKIIGGIPELTACLVVLTGVFGAMFGHKMLRKLNVKNDIAIGISIGSASHVIGTSRCAEKGRGKQVVMASVAFVLVGIITSILLPVLLHLFGIK